MNSSLIFVITVALLLATFAITIYQFVKEKFNLLTIVTALLLIVSVVTLFMQYRSTGGESVAAYIQSLQAKPVYQSTLDQDDFSGYESTDPLYNGGAGTGTSAVDSTGAMDGTGTMDDTGATGGAGMTDGTGATSGSAVAPLE